MEIIIHPSIPLGRLLNGALRTRGDCTLVALSILLDIPYLKAAAIMAKIGRGKGRGWAMKFKRALPSILSGKQVCRSGSVAKFVLTHPKGKFLVWVRGHVFAVVDSVIYDHRDAPKRHVKWAWSVGTE